MAKISEAERIREHWRRRYVAAVNQCRARLCALPVGSEVDAESWYGAGWGTCESVLRELSKIARPLFRLLPSKDDSLRAVKVR